MSRIPPTGTMRQQRRVEDPQGRYSHLERRIRGLSTAIWHTHSQTLALEPMRLNGNLGDRLEAYQDLAVLLTINSFVGGPVVVTGGPVVGTSQSIAIVAKFHDPSSGGKAGFSVGHNYHSPRSDRGIIVESVHPSNLTLSQLAEISGQPVSLMNHVADLLQAFRLLSASRKPVEDLDRVHRFVFRRCWVEFKNRLDASQQLLRYPPSMTLISVLRLWRVSLPDIDVRYGIWVTIDDSSLRSVLRKTTIHMQPGRSSSGAPFLFDSNNASMWFGLFCNTLEDMFLAASQYHATGTSDCIARIVYDMQILAPLIDSIPILKLFMSDSLNSHLRMFRKSDSYGTVMGACSDNAHLGILYDERKCDDTYQETDGQHVLRYLHSILSWHKATVSLITKSGRLGTEPPSFHVVLVPDIPACNPAPSLKMYSPKELAREVLDKATSNPTGIGPSSQNMTLAMPLLERLFGSSGHHSHTPNYSRRSSTPIPTERFPEEFFMGTIHTEALAMGILKGSTSISDPTPFLSRDPLNTEHLITPYDQIIGFPSSHPLKPKCCYCCSLLHDILYNPNASPSTHDVSTFVYPGFLIPWSPPSFGYGLSVQTLKIIERHLRALLLVCLNRQLRRRVRR